MHSQSYLYGENVDVPEIDPLMVARRLELLKDNLERLLEHSYFTRDYDRVNAVLKSISFWEKLK